MGVNVQLSLSGTVGLRAIKVRGRGPQHMASTRQ